MTADEILEDMKAQVTLPGRRNRRVFAGGLLPAFCEFFIGLGQPADGYADLSAFYDKHPQVTDGVNTLTVLQDGDKKKRKTIRQPYEKVARFYIFDNERVTFPSAAPHATGQWHDYQPWIDTLVTLTPIELADLADKAKEFMLSFLPERTFDPSSVVVQKPIFHILLEKFRWAERRGSEKTGAAFQAMVFAFIRADAPHLQVETRRVRTGGARVHGVGDVDAWNGRQLTISAEVKHFKVAASDVEDLTKFIGKVKQGGALGMIVATEFDAGVVQMIEDKGLRAVTLADVTRIVSLWDPLKQDAALNAFEYAIWQKEMSVELGQRLNEFLVVEGFRPSSTQEHVEEQDA